VANWRQTEKDVEWNGRLYRWSKHEQFLALIDLPRRTRRRLELALACDDADTLARLRAHGWSVRDAVALSLDVEPYRNYIQASHGDRWLRLEQPAFGAQIKAADGSRAVRVGISGRVVGAEAQDSLILFEQAALEVQAGLVANRLTLVYGLAGVSGRLLEPHLTRP
jgi:hypothetical protein